MLNISFIGIFVAFITSLVAMMASYAGLFQDYDHLILDGAHYWLNAQADEQTIVIEIDEQSIHALGGWPWPRATHAKLLKKLQDYQVKGVIFDILFAEESRNNPQDDEEFATTIGQYNNVVLPIYIGANRKNGPTVEIPPATIFYQQDPIIGHAHINCDLDGICRSVYLKEGLGSAHWPHLALAWAKTHGEITDSTIPGLRAAQPQSSNPTVIRRDFHNYIPFPKSHNEYKSVSYVDVLNDKFDQRQFKGHTVFIGATAVGLSDIVATPIGRVPGVYVNAFIYQGLKNQSLISSISALTNAIVTATVSFFTLMLLLRLPPLLFLIGTVCSLVVVLVAAEFAILMFQLWVPPTALIVAIVIFYPLWSWLKIQAAYGYLRNDLSKFSEDALEYNNLFRTKNPTHAAKASGFMGMDVVERTLKKLRDIKQTINEQRFLINSTLNNLDDGVIVADSNGQIVLSNQTAHKLFSISESDIVTIDSLLSEKTIARDAQWKEYIANIYTAQGSEIELKIDKGDIDQYLLCRALITRFKQEKSGDIDVIILTFTDITQVKAAEQSRIETLNFLSHDLRSPMVSILALISNIQSGVNNDALQANLDKLTQYTQRNLDLSESILQLGRAEAVKPAQFCLVDLHATIDNAYFNIHEQARSKSIEMIIEKQDCDLWVDGDPDLLERCVQNIISNSIKYCKPGSKISLGLSYDPSLQLTCICISDNGPGIPANKLENLFKRYKTAHNSANKTGVGLGLYFVKTVMDKHRGQIDVVSAPGEGLQLTLKIPFKSPDFE